MATHPEPGPGSGSVGCFFLLKENFSFPLLQMCCSGRETAIQQSAGFFILIPFFTNWPLLACM